MCVWMRREKGSVCIKVERKKGRKGQSRREGQSGWNARGSYKSFFTQKDALRFRIRSTYVFFGFHRSPLPEKAMLVFEICRLDTSRDFHMCCALIRTHTSRSFVWCSLARRLLCTRSLQTRSCSKDEQQ